MSEKASNTNISKPIMNDYRRDGSMLRRKLLGYIPAMIMTNLSNLLLVSVDGVVVGNFVGSDAFASVNIFGPINRLIGAVTVLAAVGISTTLATAIGSNRQDEIDRARGASFQFMIIMAVFVSIIQIPLVHLVIASYHLDPDMTELVWQYAIGIMICSPLGMLSTIGVYQLQIVGKMNVLMKLSVLEGISNVIFDLLFVGVFDMGVAGAGYGTACSNLIRAASTVLYLSRYTDIYKRDGYRTDIRDFAGIIRIGAPDATYAVMGAFQSYFMMQLLLYKFGSDGAVINGVCTFCFNLSFVLTSGLQGAMRPLVGLLTGADDRKGLSMLMNIGFGLNSVYGGICIAVVMLFPEIFFSMNGVSEIPEGGIESLCFYSLVFIVKGVNVLIRLYLANRKDSAFAVKLNVAGLVIMPVAAYILAMLAPVPWMFLSYVITEAIVFTVLNGRYIWWKNKDKAEDYNDGQQIVLYMTVTPDEAVAASGDIRDFADGYGINPKISNSVALAMEEMVAYADSVRDSEGTGNKIKNKTKNNAKNAEKQGEEEEFSVQVMIRFRGQDAATFVTYDDGHSINLEMEEKERELTVNNYEVLRRLSKSLEYQYILNMNYTTIKFEA